MVLKGADVCLQYEEWKVVVVLAYSKCKLDIFIIILRSSFQFECYFFIFFRHVFFYKINKLKQNWVCIVIFYLVKLLWFDFFFLYHVIFYIMLHSKPGSLFSCIIKCMKVNLCIFIENNYKSWFFFFSFFFFYFHHGSF